MLREGAVVWSGVIEIKDALSSKVTVKSGLDWDTARGDRWSEWRLADRTRETALSTEYQGDVFTHAVPPGTTRCS